MFLQNTKYRFYETHTHIHTCGILNGNRIYYSNVNDVINMTTSHNDQVMTYRWIVDTVDPWQLKNNKITFGYFVRCFS